MDILSFNSVSSLSLNEINFALAESESMSILTDSDKTVDSLYKIFIGKSQYNGSIQALSMECREYPAVMRQLCGFVNNSVGVYEDSTVKFNIIVYSQYCGFKREDIESRVHLLLKKIGLWEFRDILVRKIDTVSKLKLRIILACMHSPKLLFLFDVFKDFEREELEDIFNFFDYLKKNEKLSFVNITTNSDCCLPNESTYIIVNGKTKAYGLPSKIIAENSLKDLAVIKTVDSQLSYDGEYQKNKDGSFSISISDGENISDIIKKVVLGGNQVVSANLKSVTLEDVFRFYCEAEKEGEY